MRARACCIRLGTRLCHTSNRYFAATSWNSYIISLDTYHIKECPMQWKREDGGQQWSRIYEGLLQLVQIVRSYSVNVSTRRRNTLKSSRIHSFNRFRDGELTSQVFYQGRQVEIDGLLRRSIM